VCTELSASRLLGLLLRSPIRERCSRFVARVRLAAIDQDGVLQQLRQAHAVAFGRLAHPLGKMAANRHGQHVVVRPRPRTARCVRLCGARRLRVGMYLRPLRVPPLTARLWASLGGLTAAPRLRRGVARAKNRRMGWCGLRGSPLLPGVPTPLSRGGSRERRRLLRPRVRVQITSRGLQVSVVKQFLDGAHVHAIADEVSGEGVAQAVGGDVLVVEAGALEYMLQHATGDTRVDAAAAHSADEKKLALGLRPAAGYCQSPRGRPTVLASPRSSPRVSWARPVHARLPPSVRYARVARPMPLVGMGPSRFAPHTRRNPGH